jgi:hypothetical protein
MEMIETFPDSSNDVDPEAVITVRKSNIGGIEGNALFANRDIKKGTIFGWYDASTVVEVSHNDFEILGRVGKTSGSPDIQGVTNWLQKYGFSGESAYQCSLSSKMTFANHACTDELRNIKTMPFVNSKGIPWNPIQQRHRVEFDVLVVATKDIKRGDMILENYGTFSDDVEDHEELKQWCGIGVTDYDGLGEGHGF